MEDEEVKEKLRKKVDGSFTHLKKISTQLDNKKREVEDLKNQLQVAEGRVLAAKEIYESFFGDLQ